MTEPIKYRALYSSSEQEALNAARNAISKMLDKKAEKPAAVSAGRWAAWGVLYTQYEEDQYMDDFCDRIAEVAFGMECS